MVSSECPIYFFNSTECSPNPVPAEDIHARDMSIPSSITCDLLRSRPRGQTNAHVSRDLLPTTFSQACHPVSHNTLRTLSTGLTEAFHPARANDSQSRRI
jgi:hypothetical protein